ncbi:hypothetical protein COV82_06215 [Candidatus Peregrinibacteria bacterium CG11_big_fil_rev_8_21_14_0_20_46_8]|nr:MAG: hypothetical protein COV82_06215 [Candidatus Peregrinibacteria bacterium CG11_big_fil_rev_8_21_14_0_20_46_8]
MNETVYGEKKKLQLITQALEKYCAEHGTSQEKIHILDVGCGTGQAISQPLAQAGYTIIGLDIDAATVQKANSLNSHKNLTFVHSSIEHFKQTGFDVVIASEVLEHVPDPRAFLEEMRKKIKPKGIIIITTPNGYGWFEMESLLYNKLKLGRVIERFLKTRWAPEQPSDETIPMTLRENDIHLQHFTMRSLEKLFTEAQLQPQNIANTTLMAGPFTNTFFWRKHRFLKWNTRVADKLPHWLTSGWCITLSQTQK